MMKSQRLFKKHKKIVGEPKIGIFTKKEFALIIIFILIATFISFIPKIPNPLKIISNLIIFSIIIFTALSVKKLTASYYAIKIEHKIWEFQRFWYRKKSYFKKPLPFGLIAPFFISILSIGYLKPFTFLQFDAENLPEKRLLKYSGQRRAERKEMINEEDIAYTAASGFYSLLFLALAGLLIKSIFNIDFGEDLAKYSIYYSLWNMIPFSQLDGSKLFFSSLITWIFILILQIIFLLIIIF